MKESRTQCTTCDAILFTPLFEWRGAQECPACYSAHKEEIDTLWAAVSPPHSVCACCQRPRSCGIPFHYDHLNMFEKEDSICLMVRRGDPVEEILAEVDKCQVLCSSCHALVTKLETALGFRRMKINLTRARNGTSAGGVVVSPEREAELVAHYRTMYERHVVRLYPLIAKLIRESS